MKIILISCCLFYHFLYPNCEINLYIEPKLILIFGLKYILIENTSICYIFLILIIDIYKLIFKIFNKNICFILL